MKLISTIALLAALAVTPILAQSTAVSTGVDVGGGASVEAGGVSVNTSASAGADANASAGSGTSTSSSNADGTTSSIGSTTSSVSSQLTSDASGLSSSQEPVGPNGMTADQMCASINSSNLGIAAIDAAALDAVTSVTVLSTSDCSGLTGVAGAGADIQSSLRSNATVAAALQAQGDVSTEIVGYVLDGTSLTVFVRNK